MKKCKITGCDKNHIARGFCNTHYAQMRRKGFPDGSVNSCITHGMTGSPTWMSWQAMIARCTRPSSISYKHYGAKGIKICDRWRDSFINFLADMGERPAGKTLDRRKNNMDYCPENCRWSSVKEQNENRSNTKIYEFDGKYMNLYGWAKELNTSPAALHYRINKMGLSVEIALSTPILRGNSRKTFL
jgi:hypothetical protein